MSAAGNQSGSELDDWLQAEEAVLQAQKQPWATDWAVNARWVASPRTSFGPRFGLPVVGPRATGNRVLDAADSL